MTIQRILPVAAAIALATATAANPTTVRAQQPASGAPSSVACDMQALEQSEAEFKRQQTLASFRSEAASTEGLRIAAADYGARADACYHELYANATDSIDTGGLWFFGVGAMGSDPYVTFGTKWGANSPYPGGDDVPGPGTPGGTVTYSYMPNGVDNSAEGEAAGNNVAITSLPTFQPCFLTDINNALSVWSLVANIHFVQTTDNGLAFNQSGATGDIRIGAHTLDGVSSALAHGYYPPPNGTSAAGDVHFDALENWSCTAGAGVFDIGIVAIHEIGHAIGLGHEFSKPAIMQPFYNPGVATLQADDSNGATSIYGLPFGGPVTGDDLVIDFGPFGAWQLYDGNTLSGYASIHDTSPEGFVTADMDGNGIDEVVADFGVSGIWIRRNNGPWEWLHDGNPNRMAAGDLDGNGQDEVIIDFPGAGIWIRKNDAAWEWFHPYNSNYITVAHLDTGAGADVIIDFPGHGLWVNYNDNPNDWSNIHSASSQKMAVVDFDGNGRDDLVVNFTGFGLWTFANNEAWNPTPLHQTDCNRLIAGNLDGDSGNKDDLIVDFGAAGIWVLRNASVWSFIHPGPSEYFAIGDLNDNGKDDLIVDFGRSGLWTYADNGSWIRLHAADTEGLAVGEINAPD
jgi:hypothetical protein